jgi:hypothetical protein
MMKEKARTSTSTFDIDFVELRFLVRHSSFIRALPDLLFHQVQDVQVGFPQGNERRVRIVNV